jgi:LacI family transcriptional regulator/LacI family repressor for deo operon, udp, cdd, tsx, nupC, and nupG
MEFNIGDVARLANVSKATVSAVINKRPGVATQTRENVLRIIKKLNYRPNQVARSLSVRATKSIGLVIKEIDNPHFARVIKGVFNFSTRHGYTVILGSSEHSPEKEQLSIEALTNQRVDGIIVSPLQYSESDFGYLAELISRKYPLVTLGEVKNYATNVVDINNEAAAYQAVSFLVSRGHRKVAYFCGPTFSAHSKDRLRGYQQALIDHRVPLDSKMILNAGPYFEDGYSNGKQMFAVDERPTAVFCYNDLVAIGLIHAVLELGLRVPDDVAVIGFDDIDFCRFARIPLTTIHVPAYEIGTRAAELLMRQINNRGNGLVEKNLLEAYLVKRESA